MASGKKLENSKKLRNFVLEDRMMRHEISLENKGRENWKRKWFSALEEYNKLYEELNQISKESAFMKNINKDDKLDLRSIKPIPETTNQTYGWIANMPQFKLEKYTPDYYILPLPSDYHLFNPYL